MPAEARPPDGERRGSRPGPPAAIRCPARWPPGRTRATGRGVMSAIGLAPRTSCRAIPCSQVPSWGLNLMSLEACPMSASKKIRLKGVKINTLIPAASLVGLVPPEPKPAGTPVIDLEIEGSPLVIRATLNGKSVRRALKMIAEHGADGVNALLQGNLKPSATEGGPYILDTAGLAVTPKVAKPEGPGASEPGG